MNELALYTLRLAAVCLAAFFVLHTSLSLMVFAVSPLAVRWSTRLRASAGARVMFVLRVLPLVASTVAVMALCVPSYIRFEHDAMESVGLPCLLLALGGVATVMASAVRVVRAVALSKRMAAHSSTRPVFALAGIFRPRILVSPAVQEMLTSEQMEAAMRHEAAHATARDNMKRLAMIAAPRFLIFTDAHESLERQWARLSEWAADEAAVACEPRYAVALAEALVRVARLSTRAMAMPTTSSLVASPDDLAQRIQRILAITDADRPNARNYMRRGIVGATYVVVCIAPFSHALQSGIHTLMERLVQ